MKAFVVRGPADPATYKEDLAKAQKALLPQVDEFQTARIRVRTKRRGSTLIRRFSIISTGPSVKRKVKA